MVHFDISPKITALALITILSIYIGTNFQELFLNEGDTWSDIVRIRMVLEGWPFNDYADQQERLYM